MTGTAAHQSITTQTDRETAVTRVYRNHDERGAIYLGRVFKVNVNTSSPRGGAYRTGWKATQLDGRNLGTFDTRKEAVAEIVARVTKGTR